MLLAELDPRGGDLLEKLFLGGEPRTDADNGIPAGARELTEQLTGINLDHSLAAHYGTTVRPALTRHLVELAGVANLRVLLGDPMVDGAARAAVRVTPELADLARTAGAETVIVDAGHWASTTGEPPHVGTADVVYAVVQADSASQNSRCLAELTALWRLLQHTTPQARLVAVVIDPAWAAADLRHLFDQQPPTIAGERRYRVTVLDRRRDRRLLGLLHSGQWRQISDKALDPFFELASPLTDPLSTQQALPAATHTPTLLAPWSDQWPAGTGGGQPQIARPVTGPSAGGGPASSPAPGQPPAVAGPDTDWPEPKLDPVSGWLLALPGLASGVPEAEPVPDRPLAAGPDVEGPDLRWWPVLDDEHDEDDEDDEPGLDLGLSPATEAALGLEPLTPQPDRIQPRRLRRNGHKEADQ